MGSSFAIGKIGLIYVSPLLLVGVRFVLAGILMVIAVLTARRPHPRGITDWLRLAAVGLFQTTGVMGCIFLSLRTISAGESSILTFVNPLLVVVFATVFLGARYQKTQWLGVLIGFLGVALSLGFDLRIQVGTGIALAGAASWAVATLLIHRWRDYFDVWVLTAYQMLFGGVLLLGASALWEKPQFTMNAIVFFVIVWLAIVGSIVQFAIWFWLLQQGDPGKISAFLFLAPFFGVLFGWFLLREPITAQVVWGGLCIFVGIFLVNWVAVKQKSVSDTRRTKSVSE
ncbi:MAG: DMT family transporter [Firmicutes bacterium]|nr:DMT family transporter [Bacillota bacterium]